MPDQRRPAEIRPLPIKRIGNRSASCDTGRMEWCLSIAVWFVFDLGRVVQAARSTRRLPVFACNLQRRTPEAVLFESPEMKLENREDTQQHQGDRPHKQHEAHSENTENCAVRVHPMTESQ